MSDKTSAIADAASRVIADAVSGTIFAAGVTTSVTTAQPMVVPIADDFSEVGTPFVTVAVGPWTSLAQPGNERLHFELLCAVWRPRAPLGEAYVALLADRDAIADAFIAHSKAYLAEPTLQSAMLTKGPGIVPQALPAKPRERVFLTLPFSIEVTTNRIVSYQPA